jgi:hypothetical protein
VVRTALGLVEPIGRHVGLAAEDRLHAVRLGALVEIERAEQVAVVGHRHGLHSAFQHLGKQLVQPDRAVQKAILRVQMQVGELGHLRRASLAPGARLIQRKSIHSLSTGTTLLAALVACAGACAGGSPGAEPTGTRVLTAAPEMIKVNPGGTGPRASC